MTSTAGVERSIGSASLIAPLRDFLHTEAAGGVVLVVAAARRPGVGQLAVEGVVRATSGTPA